MGRCQALVNDQDCVELAVSKEKFIVDIDVPSLYLSVNVDLCEEHLELVNLF